MPTGWVSRVMMGEVRKKADRRTVAAVADPAMISRLRKSARCSSTDIRCSASLSMSEEKRGEGLVQLLVDKVECVAHALDLLGILVGHLDVEFFFQGDDQVDHFERVRVEVFDER